MSKLQQLIDELCPNGVEFKELVDIATFKKGQTLKKSDMVQGDYPVVAGGVEPTCFCNRFNRQGETITISSSGANAGFVAYWNCQIMLTDAFSITPNNSDLTKYIFYVLKSKQGEIYNKKTGAGIPHVYSKQIAKIKVPTPPLEIQREIVRILDDFTELTAEHIAELTAELEVRKKQYEYYRDLLTTFGDDTEYNCLGDIGYLFTGLSGKSKDDFIGGNSNYVTYKSIFRNLKVNKYDLEKVNISSGEKQNRLEKGDVLFTGSSEVIDECGMSSVVGDIANEKIYLNSFCFGYRLHDKEEYDTDFLKHLFRSDDLRKQINKTANGVTRYNISKKSFVKVRIPKPNIDTQVKVAKKLDLMAALLSDINTGIPGEINMRNVQYEYYRDKLLKFDVK